VQEALYHKCALFNMHSFYYQSMYGWFAGEDRELMIVDEGHLIENAFLGFVELKLPEKEMPSTIPMHALTQEYLPYLRECARVLREEAERLEQIPEDSITKSQVLRYSKLGSMLHRIDNVLALLPGNPQGWVHQVDLDRWNNRVLIIRPVFVSDYVRTQLLDRADQVIVMSATILSIKHWCQSCGVNRDDVAFVRSDSPFPLKNRQIVKRYAGSLSRKNQAKSLPKVMAELKKILEEHRLERGIVHTHSYALEKAVRNAIKHPRLTYKNGNVPAMLKEHASKSNSVIVAPGLAEGLDLPDDLARFAVLLKVPYPSLGDAQVRRRFDLDKSWYNFKTALTLVQEYGRTVRHNDDYAVTYVLDSDFGRFRKIAAKVLPPWFADAVVSWEDSV
jgi:Rad3-related DNA helicase